MLIILGGFINHNTEVRPTDLAVWIYSWKDVDPGGPSIFFLYAIVFSSLLPRSRAPALPRSRAPALPRSCALALRRSGAPALLRSGAPALRRSRAPVLRRSCAPALPRSGAPLSLNPYY